MKKAILTCMLLVAATLFGTAAPASADACATYGCGGEVFNSAPDYGATAYSVRVTYQWSTNVADMNYWDKQVAPQRWAGCITVNGSYRCDIDGVYTPAGFNVWCYNADGSLAYAFTDTGWHKIWSLAKIRCRRLSE